LEGPGLEAVSQPKVTFNSSTNQVSREAAKADREEGGVGNGLRRNYPQMPQISADVSETIGGVPIGKFFEKSASICEICGKNSFLKAFTF